jgi:hypothetical protein
MMAIEHVRPDPDDAVSVTNEGFEIHHEGQLAAAVCWVAVRTISAYMHDTPSGALPCLVFTCDGPVRRVEVVRSSAGWTDLARRVESQFPGFMPAWESRVESSMGPWANEVVLWERA